MKILSDKVENAKERGVDLDPKLFAEVNRTSSRLISERNLRFQMDLTQVSKSSKDDVAYLQELIQKAQETSVNNEYTNAGEKLTSQMNGNIKVML